MAEKEQNNRHTIEKDRLDNDFVVEKKGQQFAFWICIVLIGGGVGLVALGYAIAGAVLGTTTLGSLAYTFIAGRRSKDNAKNK